ncbi:hypothetical protein BVX95_02265 [archaeon D22]|nr:hypothetical protein BVX95_02265 [archaeon D22]
MFKKRGFAQVDWTISLAIFLLYLAWFFVIIKPQVVSSNLLGPQAEEIKADFIEKTKNTLKVMPFFIETNSNSHQIFEVDLDFLNYYGVISNISYLKDRTNLIIHDNLNDSIGIYYLVISDYYTYPSSRNTSLGILVDNDTINLNSNIKIEYSNTSGLKSVERLGTEKISRIRHYQNDQELKSPNVSLDNRHMFMELNQDYQTVENRFRFIASKNSFKQKVWLNDKIESFNLTIKIAFETYTDYFINNDYHGSINNDTCTETEYKSINLSNSDDYLFIKLNKKSQIKLCDDDTLEITSDDDLQITYMFDEYYEEDYEVRYGAAIGRTYPTVDKILELNESDFSYSNFQIKVYNTTSEFTTDQSTNLLNTIGVLEDVDTQVYSKDYFIETQNEYGDVGGMILNVKVW